jgi:hypothetical protein
MRTLGVSQSLTIIVLAVILTFGRVEGQEQRPERCPPGWRLAGNPDRCLFSKGGTVVRCDGECQSCYAERGAKAGETGGRAGGCLTCGPQVVCTGCQVSISCLNPEPEVKKRNIDPNLPGKPKSSEPVPQQDTQPKGGGIFKQMKP